MKILDEQEAGKQEPSAQPRPPRRRRLRLPSPSHVVSVHGLLFLTVLLVIFFSILLPDTFPTSLTVRAILLDKSTVALLALGEMIVIAGGQFDLSVGYGLGATMIITIVLQVHPPYLPWELAVLAALAAGVGIGLVNGLLVHFAKIDSFIATLGVGTALYGFSNWYTNGQQIVGHFASAFVFINGATLFGIPAPAIYVAVIAVLLWLAFEFLPVGRYLYALGSNPRAAELTGIPRGRYIVGAFVASGLLTAIAGVGLASEIQVAQSNVGPEYLLPAFVGALLGATTIRPGRVNVWGTILAVLILAVGISGIQQLGGSFFVEPLFNGVMLLVAVGLAGYAARRRLRAPATTDDGLKGGEIGAKTHEVVH